MYVLLVSRVSSVNGSRRNYKVEKSNERASENPLKRNTIIRWILTISDFVWKVADGLFHTSWSILTDILSLSLSVCCWSRAGPLHVCLSTGHRRAEEEEKPCAATLVEQVSWIKFSRNVSFSHLTFRVAKESIRVEKAERIVLIETIIITHGAFKTI